MRIFTVILNILTAYSLWQEDINMANNNSNDNLSKYGQVILDDNKEGCNIQVISLIGEIEGHDCIQGSTKSTKYEHILPQLVS